jgi:glycerate-2-kinase
MDIGGGQFHTSTVTIEHQSEGRPRLRMQAALLDEGTIAIARAVRENLRAQHSGLRLSDAEAQQVLVSGYVTLGGRQTNIQDLVSEIVRSRSQKLLTHMRHLLQEDQTFLMFTGGGSILLEQSLHALVSAK